MDIKPNNRRQLYIGDENKTFQIIQELFHEKHDGKWYPLNVFGFNLTALLLNISETNYNEAKQLYKELNESKIFEEQGEKSCFRFPENKQSQFFDFTEKYFTAIVFAVTAVEAFVNSLIKKDNIDKTIEDIERKIDLKEKIKKIVPKSRNIEIKVSEILFWKDFCDLVDFRNDLIHPKSEKITAIVKKGSTKIIQIKSNQVEILNDIYHAGRNRDIVESARKIIKYLSDKTGCPETTPIEFRDYKFADIKEFVRQNRVNIEWID